VVDQLAVEYADRPVVFLENDVDRPLGQRIDRWWAGYGAGGVVYLPLSMVGSGHAVSSGSADFHTVFAGMVDAELERAPEAEVEAYARRVGNAVRVYVRVVNRSEDALASAVNAATVHALVWEDRKVGVTSRALRAAPAAAVAGPVFPGGACTATLDTAALAGVDWTKLHTAALVDYRPGGAAGAWDMLQAALAPAPDLIATPASLAATLHAGSPEERVGTIALRGPYVLSWTASTDALWLAVTPGAGSVPAEVEVRVLRDRLPAGVQQGHVTFTATSADGMSFTRTVTVNAELAGPQLRMRRRVVRRAP
jgi:hypothetical protein